MDRISLYACIVASYTMKLPDGYTPGAGVVKSSGFGGFGEKILKTFGWQKGRGLGRAEQGMSSAIEIRKKEDQIGVGFGPDRNWNAWWESGFEEAAKGVRVAAGAGTSRDGSSDDSSDDEGGEWKARRSLNRDGTVATGSAQELRLLESLAKAGGRVAAGRFGGRDAKMERIRRQEELEAQRMREKLGLVEAVPAAPLQAREGGAGGGERRKSSNGKKAKKEKNEEIKGKQKEKKKEKEKKGRKRAGNEEGPNTKKKNRRIVIECGNIETGVDGGRSEAVAALRPTPSSGWWGCQLFRSAGAMDSSPLKKKTPDDEATGFSEEQQAKIYETAQLGKSSGKTGLGKGRRGTIKIEGAVWSGTKLKFGDDQNNGGGDDVGRSDRGEDDVKDKEVKLVSADVDVINWNKLVKRVLRKSLKKGGSSARKGQKIKSLHKDILSHLGREYPGITEVDRAEVKVSVEKCIGAKRSSFVVSSCGKYVSLSV